MINDPPESRSLVPPVTSIAVTTPKRVKKTFKFERSPVDKRSVRDKVFSSSSQSSTHRDIRTKFAEIFYRPDDVRFNDHPRGTKAEMVNRQISAPSKNKSTI